MAAAHGGDLGALPGGLVGPLPVALISVFVGHGPSCLNASRHERLLADGGAVPVMDAPEIQPATEGGDIQARVAWYTSVAARFGEPDDPRPEISLEAG
jgi:hypothetical protein